MRCECGGTYVWSDYCGCHICDRCGDHVHLSGDKVAQHLACCFCGWNAQKSDPEARCQEEWDA